jgi:hypothetical protein
MPARPSRFVPPLLAVSLASPALPATAARADPGGGLPSFVGSVISRAYDGRAEHGRSALSYVEITHAHHSDSTAPGYDNRYVPLGFYLRQALDLMWARLTEGRPLPPSQVVRTVPRGGEPGHAPALTRADVPPLSASPAPGDRIRVRSGAVQVPD